MLVKWKWVVINGLSCGGEEGPYIYVFSSMEVYKSSTMRPLLGYFL